MASQPENAKPMVGWYDPRQLAQTAVEVAISTIFGRHSDHRLVEAMAAGDHSGDFYDYSFHCGLCDKGDEHKLCEPDPKRPRDSIWIDYVGDVGDGWNPTYAIAYYLSQPLGALEYTSDGKTFTATATERGNILIFGGDEVYPTASRKSYEERLVVPYETALRNTDPPSPHVFAIPGNHDWYDSLVAFTRLFTARPWFAGWRTRQSRSYFALKLPHNWWLLGTDVQLGSDIDAPQMKYFEKLSEYMEAEKKKTGIRASVILCHAEPHWIRAAQYEGFDPNYSESNLRILEKRLGKDVAVFIAGDLHHYRRHEAEDQSTQKITAGGGGAFLHPTHAGLSGLQNKSLDRIVEKDVEDDEPDGKATPRPDKVFNRRGIFPSPRESWFACLGNLFFPFFIFMRNASWSLGLVTGGLYLLLTLPMLFRINDANFLARDYSPGSVIGITIQTMLGNPVVAMLVLLVVVGFVFFTDTHKKLHRFIGGGMHGLAHIFAAFYLAFLSVSLLGNNLPRATWRTRAPWPSGFEFFMDWRKLIAIIAIFFGGFVLGTFIMGLYVLISLNIFGRHGNEAFSSLGIEDWKSFLRMQIDTNGNLTIFPIGIKRVPRKWKPNPNKQSPEWIPDEADTRATKPHLIEEPIFMTKAKTDTGARREPYYG